MQGSATESTSGRAERSVEKLFWAISSCQLRIKAKYPGMRAGRRHSASDFPHKKAKTTTPPASKEKSPPALTCCCLTAIEAAAKRHTAHLTTSPLSLLQ
jgi:hypothetical protein